MNQKYFEPNNWGEKRLQKLNILGRIAATTSILNATSLTTDNDFSHLKDEF